MSLTPCMVTRVQTVDKLDENRVCLQFFLLVQIWTLISTSGTRFPRAVREPPRRTCACGVSLGLAIPAGVSHTRSNQLCLKIWIELLLPTVFFVLK
jgi:hypothetical protein